MEYKSGELGNRNTQIFKDLTTTWLPDDYWNDIERRYRKY